MDVNALREAAIEAANRALYEKHGFVPSEDIRGYRLRSSVLAGIFLTVVQFVEHEVGQLVYLIRREAVDPVHHVQTSVVGILRVER